MMKLGSFLVAGTAVALAAFPAFAGVPESNDTIKMMTSSWSSITLQGQIAGQILQKLGYTVQYIPADDSGRYPAFENGDLTFAMETWATTQMEAFNKSVATGNTLDMGALSTPAKEEWWFPEYMKERCPGLPDWRALKDPKCAQAFSTPETAPKGRYLSGPVDWGGHDEERVQSLGLPFEVVHAGSDASLFAELQSAYERKDPIVLWVYTPSWVPAKFQGEWVQFPEWTKECYDSGKYDCGKPHGWIKKMAWAGGEKKWPCAYSVIRAYDMDAPSLDKMVAEIDLDGKKVEDVAKEWIDANQAKWSAWTVCAKSN